LGKKLDIYANPAQQLVLQSEADRITMIMGRGGGKGHTLGLKLGISARQTSGKYSTSPLPISKLHGTF
jgi:hypothetical protein